MKAIRSYDLVEQELRRHNRELAKILDGEVIVLCAPMGFGVDDEIRGVIEELQGVDNPPSKLVVLLQTTGGFIEVVERIYAVFRKHYGIVDFIIPNFAYSAGTVLVLSGDNIYMDYYSVLGPIDPQYENEAGEMVPGMGYLAKYKELLAQINGAATQEPPVHSDAELAYLIKKFDPAKLFSIEQACAHAESLLKVWLPRHKFKDWKVTEGSKVPVTPQMREERAKQIAAILGKPQRWNSHGRGIGIVDLAGNDIKLQVTDFGQDEGLSKAIRTYYELFIDCCKTRKARAAIHSQLGYRSI